VYLLDTNVVSEIRKGSRCDAKVSAWFGTVEEEELFLSCLLLGEIRTGIEELRRRRADDAALLENWLDKLVGRYTERILPIDSKVSDEWGRLMARATVPVVDALMAATARTNGLLLVTRNVRDFELTGARVFNPFEYAKST
jgi:predicted nucleic acid-binding protein